MDLSIRFLILVLFGLVLGGSTQVSPQADLLLNQTETNVLKLVKRVQANDLNSCDLLSTCSSESTCSRLACPLTNANTTGYECQAVLQNNNCRDNCPWRNFDFSRSFLSWGKNPTGCEGSTPKCTVHGAPCGSICRLQRRASYGIYLVLYRLIGRARCKKICSRLVKEGARSEHCNRLYNSETTSRNLCSEELWTLSSKSIRTTLTSFISISRQLLALLGSFQEWINQTVAATILVYLASTSNVKKAVMVLIDSGSSMTEIIPSTRSDTNFTTSFRITESFLNTTSKDDYVNILTFDEEKVEPFSVQPVMVTNTSTHPDFGVFTAMLSAPYQSSVPSGNITEAISEAITSSAGFGNRNISSDYLKVIILITDSNAVDAISNAALPWDLIKNNNISVFLYMFPPSTAAIDASPLASQLCDARGYFKILDDTVYRNPLLGLEAYYSFIAKVYATYVNDGVTYSNEHSDFSEVDNRTFTLSKAVFSNNGELLGVAAIDIKKTKLLKIYGIDEDIIKEAVRKRANCSSFNASAGFNTITCINQTTNRACNQTANISNIVCSSNFNTDITTLRKLSCCGPCTGADKPRNLRLALGLGFGLGIPALILVVALTAWLFKAGGHQPDVHADEFSGQSGEDEDVR